MSNLKDLVKNGWHPEKEGTTLKGQVSSLMGRNKDSSSSSSSSRAQHVARPLSDLKDPSAFAAPPRRTASSLAQPPAAAEPPRHDRDPEPEPPPPSQAFQRDTTGLRTDHLPPPPGRRDGADGRGSRVAEASRPAPPRLPPRLPPRGASHTQPPPAAPDPQPVDGYLNQGSVSRLGAAGVSVPALGIGRAGSAASSPNPGGAATKGAGAGSGLGSRVGALQGKLPSWGASSGSSTKPPPDQPPGQGTTWAQKQAALKTASAFQKNPSSVSLADARAAASTANNFRQRHGDQVQAGVKRANDLNQKYGVMDKVGAYVSKPEAQVAEAPAEASTTATEAGFPGAKKKPPPPPPPKKKPGVGASAQPSAVAGHEAGAPPPIPMSTRPAF